MSRNRLANRWIVNYDIQKISEQVELDKNVVDLLDSMALALDLGLDDEELVTRWKRSKNHEKANQRIWPLHPVIYNE